MSYVVEHETAEERAFCGNGEDLGCSVRVRRVESARLVEQAGDSDVERGQGSEILSVGGDDFTAFARCAWVGCGVQVKLCRQLALTYEEGIASLTLKSAVPLPLASFSSVIRSDADGARMRSATSLAFGGGLAVAVGTPRTLALAAEEAGAETAEAAGTDDVSALRFCHSGDHRPFCATGFA